MKTRIHLVHAPDPELSAVQNFGNRYMPTWAFICASYVPETRYTIGLSDTRVIDPEQIPEADLFLMSGLNQDLDWINTVWAVLRARYPHARFALGGPVCWSYDKSGEIDQLTHFDYICIGDGELLIPMLLAADADRSAKAAQIIRRTDRFDLAQAQPMHRPLLREHAKNYYGALVEVSRGCPFLCEFCDIRVMHDNNRAHNYPPRLLIEEMDCLSRLGVTSFMFACDNFIGELGWASEVVDHLIAWRQQSGFRPSIFTWLTINLYKQPDLMQRMRKAGFDMLFIGVETFDNNSLLETAKVQNHTVSDIPTVLRTIQSYGFVITPGLIFGFDSDGEDLYDKALEGMTDAGLLASNPSLLIALPGTPLYRRMRLAGRLRETRTHIGRYKIQSNIRYLLPRETLIRGYIDFAKKMADGRHQYQRLRRYYDTLDEGQYIALEGGGYGNLPVFLGNLINNRAALLAFSKRMVRFTRNPRHAFYALRGLKLIIQRRRRVQGGGRIFTIWLYGWTNAVQQSVGLRAEDFDIESHEGPIVPQTILPEGYEEIIDEDIPSGKTRAQRRATIKQLKRLLQSA